MFLCYQEAPIRSSSFNYNMLLNMNGTDKYVEHYYNYLYLSFMIKKGNFQERGQASRELAICERKLAYWQRHPNFCRSEAEQEVAKLKKQWR